MATLKNNEIYSGNPMVTAPAVAALSDILRQRVNRETGNLLRRISRQISQQVEDVSAEHKRIIELYSPKDGEGNPLPLKDAGDLTDKAAFEEDYDALMRDTFQVDGIPVAMLDGMSLTGSTWASSLIEEDAPEKKEEAPCAPGGGA